MYRSILFIVLSFLSSLCAFAAEDVREQYIEKYSSTAVREMKRTGVPASITLAQGILESDSGRSTLAVKGNNHFGIKCHNDWKGKTIHKDAEAANECFRAYKNADESFKDHSDFLRYRNRYKSLFELEVTNYKAWAEGLKAAGYATDPAYPQKLIKLIEDYKLYRFDTNVAIEVAPPAELESPKPLEEDSPESFQYKEELDIWFHRQVFTQNGVPFVYALEGETYEDLAHRYNLYLWELLKFNDLPSPPSNLKSTDIVYLKAKKKKAAKGLDKYVVGPEEKLTLWDISQRYAVKLSSLQKYNPFAYGNVLEEGDSIKLR